MRAKHSILYLAFFAGLIACKKRENPLAWNVDWSAPIANGTIGLEALLTDSLLYSNADSSLSIKFETTLYELDIEELANVPDTGLLDTVLIEFPIPLPINPGYEFTSEADEIILNIGGGAELTSISLTSGSIHYSLKSTIKGIVNYKYEIPSAIDAMGNAFTQEVEVPAAPSNGYSTVSGDFDLSGYSVDLTGISGNEVNKIQTVITSTLSPDNIGTTDIFEDTLFINNTIEKVSINKARGYFGQHQFSVGPEANPLNLFDAISSGAFDLDEISLDFILENGIAVDALIYVNDIFSIASAGDIHLNHPIIGAGRDIPRAIWDRATRAIEPSRRQIQLTESNSNIDLMLESMPDSIGYALDVEINPYGDVSGGDDFIDVDYPFRAILNATLPLNAIANELTLVDTINISLAEDAKFNETSLYLTLENGFPMEATVDMAILDGNNMVVKHIFSPTTIPMAQIGIAGKVISNSYSEHVLALDAVDMQNLKQHKKIKLTLSFSTPAVHTYLYDYYKVKYSLSGEGDYGIEIE